MSAAMFALQIDLRSAAFKEDRNKRLAACLRSAADRIERGDDCGGFAFLPFGNVEGGFALGPKPKSPPIFEIMKIVECVVKGQLTAETDLKVWMASNEIEHTTEAEVREQVAEWSEVAEKLTAA
jgi:hypothetical protein